MSDFWKVDDMTGTARRVAEDPARCAWPVQGWRAVNVQGPITCQCRNRRGYGKDEKYCYQHARMALRALCEAGDVEAVRAAVQPDVPR